MEKRLRSSQRFKPGKRKTLLPAQTLVGFSGKLFLRKLKPLRRSKSDKIREKALEKDYFQKCSTLECRLQDHRHLVELMQQLVCCNGEDFCDLPLCQELNQRHSASIKLINFLLEQVGTSLGVLPKQTQAMLCQLLYIDKRLRVKLPSGFQLTKEQLKASPAIQGADPSSEGTEFYQIFVHGIKHDAPLVLTVKRDEPGQTLWNMVREKCPHKISSSFILLHQGRKITEGKTLREQGLTSDCNIHANFSLCGGMEKVEGFQSNDGEVHRSKDPQTWTKGQVAIWITEVCNLCGVDEAEVSMLKTLSGAELNNLRPKDWKERSPKRGGMLLHLWSTRMKTSQARQLVADDTSKPPLVSVLRGAINVTANDVPVGDSCRGSFLTNASSGGEQLPLLSAIGSQKSASGVQGPFGTVDNIQMIEIETYVSTDELSKKKPANGALISVKGLCSSTPRNHGPAGSVLLRNDPAKGGKLLELRIDLRACPESNILTKHLISTILNVKLGEELFVRGRVEHLGKKLESMKKGFKILPFKIIVDSDQHAAFRKEVKMPCSYLPQLSMPWPIECGIFPAEGSTQEALFENDTLQSTPGTLYCPPDASLEKIKECAVALKNCQTGDIFVGVSDEGAVIGSKVSRDVAIQRRKDLVNALGGILPSVDQTISICTTAVQSHELVEREKNFVAVMWIQSKTLCPAEALEETEEISILFRIHVVKGSSVISFVKPEHTHAYVRIGTETKLMTDYEDLFNRMKSLANRNVPKKISEAIDHEVNKASVYEVSDQSYRLFESVTLKTDRTEFKEMPGDPKKIILTDYVKKYSASFLNSEGGDILFGLGEDRTTEVGFVVGISLSEDDRKELLHKSSKLICNFWPPVDSCQFFMRVIEVNCDLSRNVLQYPKTYVEREENFVAVVLQNMASVKKLVKYVRSKIVQSALLHLSNNRFGILVKDSSKLYVENILSEMENESFKSKYFQIEMAKFEEVEASVKDLCVVHLHVRASPYPVHLTSPFLTFCLDHHGMVKEMEPNQLIERFAKRDYQYDPDELFSAVNGFEKENTSYVLICSPFSLPSQERDLYGVVVPEWALVLDFDQNPNQEGHLLNIFKPLHDRHQVERNLFVKTPLDRKLDLNPRSGVCWCAVRGYRDIAKTLSGADHASWMYTHGHRIRILIDQLITHINPNQLVVVCLWDKDQRELLPSLHFILQHIFACWGPTKVAFVCSDSSAKFDVLSELVEPMERAGFGVKRDSIFVALPHEMAFHVGAKLPPPYRSEDEFQIPRKFYLPDRGERIIPDTLPQTIRQAIKGNLQIMYQNTGSGFQPRPDDQDKLRVKFYSGSEIDDTGLATKIAIERERMEELKRKLKLFLIDKRSNISFTILKAERGAGATTLCLQLLYEYRKQYVCARLLEFHDSLASNIAMINQYSNLPVILFVDREMAYLPEFNDFKNDADQRKLNLKLLVVESCELYSQANSPRKRQPIPYFAGSTPFQTVELSRELTLYEVSKLVEHFVKIREISEEKKNELKELEERASREFALRKFAYFSLTAFGRRFTGLQSYVAHRLRQASGLQLQILEFLALTHVFTDFLFPVNALRSLAKTKDVVLESIFSNSDVGELLSPPSSVGKNLRRISFVVVAEELLQQQAKSHYMSYTLYLKSVALRLAKFALSSPRPSKRLDRITMRLYVTSEYGSEKFSLLVRFLRYRDPDVARDMLHELIEVFEKGSSVGVHLLAQLSKYYMSQYGDFKSAIPLIEEAVQENKDDVLLHHIHGDVIRLHVQNLKEQQEFSLGEVLRFAIQSSNCFVTVKRKRPLMEHGYSSDALVRKLVMLAAIKSVGGCHFVDFLQVFLDERKVKKSLRNFTREEKYVLSLVPESFANLRAMPISEFREELKDSLLKNLGNLEDLKLVCEDLKKASKGTEEEDWVDVVALKTMSLVYSLEDEKKQFDPGEADERIKSLEELSRKTDFDEECMKMWIRCVRLGSRVPNLKSARKTMDEWLNASGRRSPNALFYNYVVAILEALGDPHDTEKMRRASECVIELLRKRKSPKSDGNSLNPSVPVEWLHPKNGRHVNSLDSLLCHEDLVREYFQGNTPLNQKRADKEIIEKALFQKNITKWEGVVSEITSDWKGMIRLKKHINVSFVPVNVQLRMPNEGDEVQFCLAFHWTGPCAWNVFCGAGAAKARKAVTRSTISFSQQDYTDSETSDEDEEETLLPLVPEPLHIQAFIAQKDFVGVEGKNANQWSKCLDSEKQGIIFRLHPRNGYGWICHPDFSDDLFFHVKQIVPPVDSLSSIEVFTVVSFTVGETEKGPRAMNIKTVEEKNIDSQLAKRREELQKEERKTPSFASASAQRSVRKVQLAETLDDLHQTGSRQEGQICELRAPPHYKSFHGFISVPFTPERLFFQESLSGISKRETCNIRTETIVQFSVGKDDRGRFFAKNIFIKPPETTKTKCNCGWEDRIGNGIQEGFIGVLKAGPRYGFITKECVTGRKATGVYFHESQLIGYPFTELVIGDKVHFVVDQNDKGCIAKQISVVGKPSFPTVPQQGNHPSSLADPRLFSSSPRKMFYNHQGRIGLHSPSARNRLAGHSFQDRGGHSDGWQHVTGRRKR